MCLTPEQRHLMDRLDQEDRDVAERRLGHGGSLTYEVRQHHADLAFEATRSEAGRRAFDEHRQAHRAEAERIRAARNK